MPSEFFVVALNSEQPERLRVFYQDVIGLVPKFEFAAGAFATNASAAPSLIIEGHSEVRGHAKEPQRMLLNFLVADAAAEEARLEALGVDFVRTAYEEEGVGVFATFSDPDGNYCQLVELYE